MHPASQQHEASYQFGAYELDPVRRLLLRAGKPIALKPKVFETLLVLVRNGGRVMDKDELMQQVWPGHRRRRGHNSPIAIYHIQTIRPRGVGAVGRVVNRVDQRGELNL